MEVFETRDESYWDSYLIMVEVFLAPNNFQNARKGFTHLTEEKFSRPHFWGEGYLSRN